MDRDPDRTHTRSDAPGPDRSLRPSVVHFCVGVSVFAVIGALVASVFLSSRGSFDAIGTGEEFRAGSRLTAARIQTDLRPGNGSPESQIEILVGDRSRLAIQDLAATSATARTLGAPSSRVVWYWDADAGALVRESTEEREVLIENVLSCEFRYRDALDLELANVPLSPQERRRVRAVEITVTAKVLDGRRRSWSAILPIHRAHDTGVVASR